MKKKLVRAAPIGVFDSGLGGLTVVREIGKQLPAERIIYFGDIARLPYGTKSNEQIRDFSRQNADFLIRRGVKAVVIACNSSASIASAYLKSLYPQIPMIDVIAPAALEAAQSTRNLRVGVMGTQATVEAGSYGRALRKVNSKIQVYAQACPLLVPLVEEGILNGDLTHVVLSRYLTPVLNRKIDTLILGCTHYPLLQQAIRKTVGPWVKLINSAPATVRRLKDILNETGLLRPQRSRGSLEIFVSDRSRNFQMIGARFLGRSLRQVKRVRFEGEVMECGRWM